MLIFFVFAIFLRKSIQYDDGRQVLKPGLVKGQWSAEEDDRLVELVNKGFRNWGQVRVH